MNEREELYDLLEDYSKYIVSIYLYDNSYKFYSAYSRVLERTPADGIKPHTIECIKNNNIVRAIRVKFNMNKEDFFKFLFYNNILQYNVKKFYIDRGLAKGIYASFDVIIHHD